MRNPNVSRCIGITMGDPTGIGPEVIAGALGSSSLAERVGLKPWTPVVIGRASIMQRAASLMQVDLSFEACEDWGQVESLIAEASWGRDQSPNRIACLQAAREESESARDGCIDAHGGQAAYDCLVRATELCRSGHLAAIVTAPLQKKGMELAGHHWPGHTELLAHLCGVENTAMMLYLPPGKPNHGGPFGLGVIHVTLHMALREIFQWITQENILRTIQMTESYFSKLISAQEGRRPRIAVTALNPHAGESGRFGREEIEIIAPAVHQARELGIDVSGPWAVDTLMPRAARGDFDAVVAMYHDQGHIALKLLDMFEAVNITLGLPIVRTSVAHGTAHDIAWKGVAESAGMAQAIVAAVRLSG